MKRRWCIILFISCPVYWFILCPWPLCGKKILDFSQKICAVYIIAAILFTINGLLLVMLDVYNAKDKQKNRPMKGFVQVLQVLLFFIGGIVIIAVLVNKSR